jgi:hypothetical protein
MNAGLFEMAADLDGARAVARLERRGGEVWVFRRGHGSKGTFRCTGREEDGAAIVVGSGSAGATSVDGEGRWVLRTDLDRRSLAGAMEATRDRLNASAGGEYALVHRDLIQSDAGFGQVGCLMAVASVIVGLVIGLVVVSVLGGAPTLVGSGAGVIIGFLVGLYTADSVASVAVLVPALRDRIVNFAYAWMLIVPGVVTVLTMVVASRLGI